MAYGKRRNRRNFTRKRRSKIPRRFKRSLKAVVSKAISARLENKIAGVHQQPQLLYCIPFTGPGDGGIPPGPPTAQQIEQNFLKIVPKITQGTGGFHNRVGLKIHPKYMVIKGWVYLSNDTAASGGTTHAFDTVMVRLVVGKVKQFPLAADALNEATSLVPPGVDCWVDQMVDNVNGVTPYLSNLNNLSNGINRRIFDVMAERRIRLTRDGKWIATHLAQDTTYTTSNTGVAKFFKIRVPLPKVWTYESDVGSDLPSNFCPFMWAAVTPLDGEAPLTSWHSLPVQIQYTVKLSYEDA